MRNTLFRYLSFHFASSLFRCQRHYINVNHSFPVKHKISICKLLLYKLLEQLRFFFYLKSKIRSLIRSRPRVWIRLYSQLSSAPITLFSTTLLIRIRFTIRRLWLQDLFKFKTEFSSDFGF